jgi:leukotriene-A4 hydrolase
MTIGRQLLPSQDTPAVKFPFYLGIRVKNPLRGMISGLYDKNETNGDDTTTFYYNQKIPVPNYLIALAAGNIEERIVNEQVSVFSEPEYIDEAVKEFEDIPKFLNYSQEYMGHYEWGKYNVPLFRNGKSLFDFFFSLSYKWR